MLTKTRTEKFLSVEMTEFQAKGLRKFLCTLQLMEVRMIMEKIGGTETEVWEDLVNLRNALRIAYDSEETIAEAATEASTVRSAESNAETEGSGTFAERSRSESGVIVLRASGGSLAAEIGVAAGYCTCEPLSVKCAIGQNAKQFGHCLVGEIENYAKSENLICTFEPFKPGG